MKKTNHLIPIVLLGMWPLVSNAQPGTERQQQLMQALQENADYIADVLINDEGYSRCDHNTVSMKKFRQMYTIRDYNLNTGGSWSLSTIW